MNKIYKIVLSGFGLIFAIATYPMQSSYAPYSKEFDYEYKSPTLVYDNGGYKLGYEASSSVNQTTHYDHESLFIYEQGGYKLKMEASFNHDPEYASQAASSSHETSAQHQQEVDFSDKRYLDSGIATSQSSTALSPDPTYLYRKIDLDDPTSTVVLNDPQMQRMHTLYLEGNTQVIEILKNDLDCELNHHKSFFSYARYLDPWRQAKMRRLSFVSRLLKHHAEQKLAVPSAQSISLADSNQTIRSFKPGHDPAPLSEGTFLSHAANLMQETISSLKSTVQRSVVEDLKAEVPLSSDLPSITSPDLEWLNKHIKEEDWVEAFFEGSSSRIGYAVEHPIECIQEFALSNAQLIGKAAMLYMDAMSAPDDWYADSRELQLFQEKAKQRADEFSQAYNQMRETIPQMTKADFARLTGRLCADMILYKTARVGLSKGIGALKNLPVALAESELLGSVQTHLERALAKNPEFVTAEGLRFKAPQPVGEAGVLKNATDKVVSGGKEAEKRVAQAKFLCNELDEEVRKLALTVSKKKIGDIYEKAHVTQIPQIESSSAAFYEKILTTHEDVLSISKNTKISQSIIEKIKRHLFLEEHILANGIRAKFCPDPNIAQAWQRLMSNNFVYSDLVLLQHEYLETLIMQGLEVPYKEAHSLVEKVYSWQSLL